MSTRNNAVKQKLHEKLTGTQLVHEMDFPLIAWQNHRVTNGARNDDADSKFKWWVSCYLRQMLPVRIWYSRKVIYIIFMWFEPKSLEVLYPNEINIFQCIVKFFCVEFQNLKFNTKYFTHTLKDTIYIYCWKFKICQIYELISAFETHPLAHLSSIIYLQAHRWMICKRYTCHFLYHFLYCFVTLCTGWLHFVNCHLTEGEISNFI